MQTEINPETVAPSVAAAEVWKLDPSHTLVEFAVKHLMIATVKGRFSGVLGSVTLQPDRPAAPAVEVDIDVATINTGDEKRDAHLSSADFFDVAKFPAMRFRATRARGDTTRRFTLVGDLTIRDVTREIELDVTRVGGVSDPWGNERIGFTATGRLNRTDFGLKWNVALEAGGVLVGEDVRISIETELVRQGNG